jgi:transposase
VLRARIVLAAADEASNADIARQVGVCEDTARTWRRRFAERGMEGLKDLRRPGRPPVFAPLVRAEATALACRPPQEVGAALARWSTAEIADELVTRGVATAVSASTVRRWLTSDAIRPWRFQSWIFPRDPDFAAKAAVVLDLYARLFGGEPLGPGDYVLCSDEKTSIQARCRCHPTLPPGRARMMRVEHEYDRGGALAYLAAYDTGSGRVIGRCEQTTGIAPFTRLVDQVVATEPYASARRVFWVVDNGSSHRGKASVKRMAKAWPGTGGKPACTLVHLPVHASWLNQVEIFYSIVQRKVVTPNDFTDLTQVEDRLLAFEDRYNRDATPFGWKYTKDDLDDLLARIAAREAAEAAPPLLAAA